MPVNNTRPFHGATAMANGLEGLVPKPRAFPTRRYLCDNGEWVDIVTGGGTLPSQTGNAGRFLTTDGTTPSWALVLPSQTGNSGKFLTTNGTTPSWATVDSLPSQTGNGGKFLTTNGTAASWSLVGLTSGVTGVLPVANGGTSQSSYTKGDILAAAASTTLNKLAVGSNDQVLTADSAQTNGIKWASVTDVIAESTVTSTGTQNDVAFTGTFVRLNNASLLTITGIVAGVGGQRLRLVSIGAGQVDIKNQDTGSSTSNRIINTVANTISLAAGLGTVDLVYDATTARWRVVAHEQGAPIAVAYSSGNFTGSGTITWTVGSGDQVTFSYILRSKLLTVFLQIDNTTVSGTGSALQIAVPAGFTASVTLYDTILTQNVGTWDNGMVQVAAGATIFVYRNATAPNWSASTDASSVRGQFTFPVS